MELTRTAERPVIATKGEVQGVRTVIALPAFSVSD